MATDGSHVLQSGCSSVQPHPHYQGSHQEGSREETTTAQREIIVIVVIVEELCRVRVVIVAIQYLIIGIIS
jgi:hypothetical protein